MFKALAAYKKADELDVDPGPLHELGHEDAGVKMWGDSYVNPALRQILNAGGTDAEIVSNFLHAIQDMEEIWGNGDDAAGYIKVMEAIKAEIEERLSNAKSLDDGPDPELLTE